MSKNQQAKPHVETFHKNIKENKEISIQQTSKHPKNIKKNKQNKLQFHRQFFPSPRLAPLLRGAGSSAPVAQGFAQGFLEGSSWALWE